MNSYYAQVILCQNGWVVFVASGAVQMSQTDRTFKTGDEIVVITDREGSPDKFRFRSEEWSESREL